MRWAILLSVVLAGAACTDFATINRNVCGNGLLEQGEDCDSSAANCVRCAVTCSTAADCPTTDYACGVDGLCHAPGGGLAAPHSAGTFEANELAVTDLDHDGIGDAIGLSRTSIVIRHGEATGQLGTLDSLVTPTQTGPAALGDLDNDGSLDLTLTTADGLVSYASTYGELAGIPVDTATLGMQGEKLDFRKVLHLGPNIIAAFLVEQTTQSVLLVLLDGGVKTVGYTGQVFQPCGARLGQISANAFESDSLDVYNVNKDTDGQIDAVIAFSTGTGAQRRACVLELHRAAPFITTPAFAATDITPTGFGVPTKKLVLADLDTDTDPCPGLVRQDAGPYALTYYDGSQPSSTAACTLATASTGLPSLAAQQNGAPPNAVVVGRAPVRPTVWSAAVDGLITNEGVYPYFPTGVLGLGGATFATVYKTTRNINRVANGDFDGDGYVDVVLSAANDQDLDVLFRAPNQPGFNLFRVDTTSTVTSLTTGDFDGNSLADIAYTEDLGDHQRLLVAYGTPDRPLAPASVGVFSAIIDVGRIGFPDSVDYLGLCDDLMVVQPPGVGQSTERATIIHGSPQRTMLSYFDPRSDTLRGQTVFRGAIIGNFVSSGTPEYQDVVAVAAPSSASATSGTQTVRAYRVPNTVNGLDGTQSNPVAIDGLADCSLNGSGKLCLDLAKYVAYPLATAHDVVVGIDKSNAAVMVDPLASSISATQLTALTSAVPMKTTVQSLHVVDFDGDGKPELVAAFAPTADDSKGGVLVCTMANGVASSCQDVVPAILSAAASGGPAVKNCFDAAPAHISYRDPTVTPNAAADIVVACRGDGTSIFRVSHSNSTVVVDRLANTGAEISGLQTGDVTGDHVDDLLLLEGTGATSLLVYPQCTSRDAATCHAASAGESP